MDDNENIWKILIKNEFCCICEAKAFLFELKVSFTMAKFVVLHIKPVKTRNNIRAFAACVISFLVLFSIIIV